MSKDKKKIIGRVHWGDSRNGESGPFIIHRIPIEKFFQKFFADRKLTILEVTGYDFFVFALDLTDANPAVFAVRQVGSWSAIVTNLPFDDNP